LLLSFSALKNLKYLVKVIVYSKINRCIFIN
jgi:hypothetical protein